MKKLLFSTKLTPTNKRLRNYILREISHYKDPAKSRILDIGCGNGRFGILLNKYVKTYNGIDPDKGYIKRAKEEAKEIKNIKYQVGKGEDFPLKSKFDVVMYSFSWHFIEDHEKALEELDRVTNKDSLIVIFEPSEEPKEYVDSRLNKYSDKFDEQLWKNKLTKLRKAREFLEKQKKFKILDRPAGRINLWLLKKDK